MVTQFPRQHCILKRKVFQIIYPLHKQWLRDKTPVSLSNYPGVEKIKLHPLQGCAEGKLITMHWNYNESDTAECGGKPFCVIYEFEDSILCFFSFLPSYACKLRAIIIQDFRKKQEKKATLFVMHLQALLYLVCDTSCSWEYLYSLFPRCW